MKLIHQRLLAVLRYNRSTGIFVWRISTNSRIKVGDVAGCPDDRGYIKIKIDGVAYYAHRLAWFYVKRRWPPKLIDHRNLKKDDNRFRNLRCGTHSQNHANATSNASNTSGFKGVSWHSRARKWRAGIGIDGRTHYLGLHSSRRAARAAYKVAAAEHFGDFAR